MYFIRPIESKDFEAMVRLAFSANLGITNLPKNEKRLKNYLELAESSFKKKSDFNESNLYLFILEDFESGMVGGICGIFSMTGFPDPLYYYKIVSSPVEKSFSEMPSSIETLKVVSYKTGPTEICSLYLDQKFRKEGLGRLLSFSRFHFIASFKERFCKTVFAEMRGFIDEKQESPFWNGLGRHFLDIDFSSLMAWRDLGIHFLPHILPKHPIYIALLNPDAKNAIGKVHPRTEPAMHLLLEQGFKLTKEIDPFDAGPRILAKTEEILEIKNSSLHEITEIKTITGKGMQVLLSNNRLDFRACFGEIKQRRKGGWILDRKASQALQVEVGDKVRFALAKKR